jgi:hypothetical protein
MPKIHYLRVIEEDPQRLKELEKFHRYSHLFQRVRMLRLLKSEECTNLGEAPQGEAQTGRPRHEKADQQEQEAFKKTSLLRSSTRAPATTSR